MRDQFRFEMSDWEDTIRHIDTLKLMRRAANRYIDISEDIDPSPDHEKHWEEGQFGSYFLASRSYRLLAKKVEQAEYDYRKRFWESHEAWLKVITLIASVIAAIASVYLALQPKE